MRRVGRRVKRREVDSGGLGGCAAATRVSVSVISGDCLDELRNLPDASVHALVTDPPYGLVFMGKAWDDHVSPVGYQQWCQQWAAECLRVLKPGGHLLAFGGTRTYHRLAAGIEDAGFEIRDSIHWVYGSGFPKSLDVSKAIDKAAGATREVVEIVRRTGSSGSGATVHQEGGDKSGISAITAPATPDAERWQGWGTALKPAHEPIIVARKPLAGTVAATVLAHGTGGINVDGCRVAHGDDLSRYERSATSGYKPGGIYGDGSPALTPASPSGRWPANLVLTHDPDCVEVGTRRVRGNGSVSGAEPSAVTDAVYQERIRVPFRAHADADGMETVVAFECAEGCPVAEMDAQSGIATRPNKGVRGRGGSTYANGAGFANTLTEVGQEVGYGDIGGASRFFPVFRYQAKAPTSERPKVEGIAAHPTVKPLALMRWLVRLVTPPGGIVLDPFAGSGTTLEAALLEGFHCVGIEREAEYLPLIEARVARARGVK